MLDGVLSEYHKRKQQLYNLLLRKNSTAALLEQCSISVSPQEFSLAYGRNSADKLLLDFYASYPYDSKEGIKTQLTSIVKQYELKKISCSWVLTPQDYQLLQIDALPVPDNEFQAAIRWKIKDLLRFPLDDVVIDYFPLPTSKINTQNKMMVVAAQSSYLQKMSDDIQAAGLKLSTIDIPELVFRNILNLFEQNNQSQVLLYVKDSVIELFITFQNELYFSRALEFGWVLSEKSPNKLAEGIEHLAAEILRSFDYYQSQWRQPHPIEILLSATKSIATQNIEQLGQSLGLPVKWLNISAHLITRQELNGEQQGKYLPLIGELYRNDAAN